MPHQRRASALGCRGRSPLAHQNQAGTDGRLPRTSPSEPPAIPENDAAITSLHWVASDAADGYSNRAKRLFPPLAPLPANAESFAFDHGASQSKRAAPEPRGLSVLVSGDCHGRICLSAHGIFLLGRVQLRPEHLRLAETETAPGADAQLRVTSLWMGKESCIEKRPTTHGSSPPSSTVPAKAGQRKSPPRSPRPSRYKLPSCRFKSSLSSPSSPAWTALHADHWAEDHPLL